MLPYRLRTTINEARRKLQRGVRRAVYGDQPTWRRKPNAVPWFDRPDAPARGNGDDVLARWVRDGYVVLDGLVAERDVDEMVGVLGGLWGAGAPIPDVTLLGTPALVLSTVEQQHLRHGRGWEAGRAAGPARAYTADGRLAGVAAAVAGRWQPALSLLEEA